MCFIRMKKVKLFLSLSKLVIQVGCQGSMCFISNNNVYLIVLTGNLLAVSENELKRIIFDIKEVFRCVVCF